MDDEVDAFKPIAPAQVNFFGGPGTMLLPSPKTVAAMLKRVPARRLITTDLLRQKLAEQFGVQGTCPMTTRRALQTIANDPKGKAPYWRVINQNGQLIDRFPGGAAAQGARLEAEGFVIDTGGPKPRLKAFKDRLVQFGQAGRVSKPR
jgi:alkylated DNA nucleotide flippase Atl1